MEQNILIVTPKAKVCQQIADALGNEYIPVFAFNSVEGLKKSLNMDFLIHILDTSVEESGGQKLSALWNDLDKTKHVPLVSMHCGEEILFSNSGFLFGKSYGIDSLKENISHLIFKEALSFYDAEDTQNFISSLVMALESKDLYSRNHSARVSRLSGFIAKNMNLPKHIIEEIEVAGLFHDIGKIGISDMILLKPGRLNDSEFKKIQQHPLVSEEICKPVRFFSPLLPIIRGHHERVDGGGYPDHLPDEKIPLGSKIIAIADTFDALTSNRAYRKAFSIQKVFDIMRDGEGTQWDADIMKCFLENISKEKTINLLKESPSKSFAKNESLLQGTIFQDCEDF